MRRGEIWWADIPQPIKPRPVIILTRNAVVDTIGSVVVALITRTRRGLPTEVLVGRSEGLPSPSVINLDNIMTIPRYRLQHLMGGLSGQRIVELNQAIRIALEVE